MVSFAELRNSSPGQLMTAAQSWSHLAADMVKLEDRTVDALTGPMRRSGWQGPAAQAAFRIFDLLDNECELAATQVRNLAAVMRRAGEEFGLVHRQLLAVISEADAQGFRVTDRGLVYAPRPSEAAFHDPDGQLIYRRQQDDAAIYEDMIRDIVAEVTELDYQFANALRTFGPDFAGQMLPAEWQSATDDARNVLQLMGMSETSIPQPGSSPAAVAAWWRSLTGDQRSLYLTAFPALVGSLNGLPSLARDDANKMALREWIYSRQGLVSPLKRDTVGDPKTWRAENLLNQLEASEYGAQPLYLLGINHEGDGQAAVAVGNPDTAAHTAVLVPGVGNDLSGIDGLIGRAADTQRVADLLTQGPSSDVAVVAWLGYDAPTGVGFLGAPFGGQSEVGAAALDQFADGLRASHPGEPADITAIGHSYGSTVVGHAATHGDGLAADRVITLGSPGVRTDHASDFNMGAQNVWAAAAHNDHVANPDRHRAVFEPFGGPGQWLANTEEAVHGPSPHRPEFGANSFVVDTSGHSGYWEPDSESLRNQARIVVGYEDRVTTYHRAATP